MASSPDIRMESSKITLVTQLLAAAISILQDAVSPPRPCALNTPTKHHGSRRHRTDGANGKHTDDHNGDSSGVVVPIGPLLKPPVEPNEEYDLAFAANYLKRGPQTIRQWIAKGKLSARKNGNGRGAWLITGEELIRFDNSSSTGEDE